MVSSGKDLERVVHEFLKPLGFRKTARTWRLDAPETIVVVNLQRSRWSESYYVNLGAMVKSVGDDPSYTRNRTRPSVVDCHYRIRVDDLLRGKPVPPAKISAEQARMHALLEFDFSPIDPLVREAELRAVIEGHVLPFLELCKSEAGIRTAIIDRLKSSHMTSYLLRKRLGIPAGI
jgi:hypothetical protein